MHKSIKQGTDLNNNKQTYKLLKKDNQLTLDIDGQLSKWCEYFEKETVNDNRQRKVHNRAIKNGKDHKADGPDNIENEALQTLLENSLQLMSRLFNSICNLG